MVLFSELFLSELSTLESLLLFAEPSVLHSSLLGHSDAVWGLSIHSQRSQLLSCSADGTVKLWTPANAKLIASYSSEQGRKPFLLPAIYDINFSVIICLLNLTIYL